MCGKTPMTDPPQLSRKYFLSGIDTSANKVSKNAALHEYGIGKKVTGPNCVTQTDPVPFRQKSWFATVEKSTPTKIKTLS